MADPKGFMRFPDRKVSQRRPVPVRLMDWKEVYQPFDPGVLKQQASRCMDCGVAFCQEGCPLGNIIPEWIDLLWRGHEYAAQERLHATNNFPEFTGKLCPAPCESACVLGIHQSAVTIKEVEQALAEMARKHSWVKPHPPERLTGKTVVVVGSGPAGLAAAQQLTRAGYTVVVYERDDRIGGLLRYGIPDFKMDKTLIDRRVAQMTSEGTRFRAGIEIGRDLSWREIYERFDAVIIATGATIPRDLELPGRHLDGVHFAMEYLVEQNKRNALESSDSFITAEHKHVVIIGGGDTGSDCLGSVNRQNPLHVTMFSLGKSAPTQRPAHEPWPMHPHLFEVQSSHEEGGERKFLASTIEYIGDEHGQVRAVRFGETDFSGFSRGIKEGTEQEISADLVLLALGFRGPEYTEVGAQLGIGLTQDNTFERDKSYQTHLPGVFVVGDAGRGQSLIVWAIAEGRSVAAVVDRYLQGTTDLPFPIYATSRGFLV